MLPVSIGNISEASTNAHDRQLTLDVIHCPRCSADSASCRTLTWTGGPRDGGGGGRGDLGGGAPSSSTIRDDDVVTTAVLPSPSAGDARRESPSSLLSPPAWADVRREDGA